LRPDLRNKDPLREAVTPDTVVYNDVVDAVAAISADLSRYEMTDQSRWATETIARVRWLIKLAEMLLRRLLDDRRAINKMWEDDAPARKERILAKEPWRAGQYERREARRKLP